MKVTRGARLATLGRTFSTGWIAIAEQLDDASQPETCAFFKMLNFIGQLFFQCKCKWQLVNSKTVRLAFKVIWSSRTGTENAMRRDDKFAMIITVERWNEEKFNFQFDVKFKMANRKTKNLEKTRKKTGKGEFEIRRQEEPSIEEVESEDQVVKKKGKKALPVGWRRRRARVDASQLVHVSPTASAINFVHTFERHLRFVLPLSSSARSRLFLFSFDANLHTFGR